MLYAIGAGGQVKAVDADSTFPRHAPRTKLSVLTPNVEAILTYRPGLVLVSSDTDQLRRQDSVPAC
jgi:iron complex transport system substrate-binding protein